MSVNCVYDGTDCYCVACGTEIGGRYLMPVAAGTVRLLFTRQLKTVMHLASRPLLQGGQTSMLPTSQCCHICSVAKIIGSCERHLSHACLCSDGWAPIHFAAQRGDVSSIEALVTKKADVDACDR